uniref:DDE Tnp4 domain-containing protein n=1 Tax=Lactuca sativa TaxID=4236 RepID=A0A9R1UQS0_LACSA|nr:hypothetical protein LSAT_V11C800398660 [Lactuca sativa]
MFKDYISAIDGTHVRASIPQNEEAKYINITLLMLDIQILEGILLHTKAQIFVIIYQIFDVDTRLLFVNLVDRKRNLTISTHHCEISLNELLECETLGGHMHVNYKYKNQVKIMIASMAIHNYIRKFGRFDEVFNKAQQESYNPIRGDTSSEVYKEGPSTRRTSDDDLYMATIRDIIAQDINTLRRRILPGNSKPFQYSRGLASGRPSASI